jgi:L-ascorbate 6-phosphate lactonase
MRRVELWALGQAGFRLRDPDDGTTIFIDPFLSDHPERRWRAPLEPQALAMADAVLCTHEHIDHFDRPALSKAAAVSGSRYQLVVPQPLRDEPLEPGLPEDRVLGAKPDESFSIGSATVHPVAACHGVHVSDAYNFGRDLSGGQVRYLGFVVEIGDLSVYHAGDTLLYPGLIDTVRELAPDLVLLPINGRDFIREQEHDIVGTMSGREAAHLAAASGAKAFIPMHWDMFAHNPGFPGEVAAYVAEEMPQLTFILPGRGTHFIYSPDAGG